MTLSVRRGDQDFQVQVTPQRMETADIFGGKVSALIIGVTAGEYSGHRESRSHPGPDAGRDLHRPPYLADRGEPV